MESLKMDQDEYINKEELDKIMDQEFDFDDIIGHKVDFSILGSKNTDGMWSITAEAVFSMSLNGMDWASITVPVAMMGVAGGLNNREILARLRYMLNQHKVDKGGIIEGGKIM